jgi:hypothetical protein
MRWGGFSRPFPLRIRHRPTGDGRLLQRPDGVIAHHRRLRLYVLQQASLSVELKYAHLSQLSFAARAADMDGIAALPLGRRLFFFQPSASTSDVHAAFDAGSELIPQPFTGWCEVVTHQKSEKAKCDAQTGQQAQCAPGPQPGCAKNGVLRRLRHAGQGVDGADQNRNRSKLVKMTWNLQ